MTQSSVSHEDWPRIAGALSEALPYIRRYDKRVVVVKYGGHAMGDVALGRKFARDLVLLKQVGIDPLVVHGGGPQIAAMLDRLKIKSSFVQGLRVTDADTVDVVEMVLAGSINKELVTLINGQGGTAIGLSGKDANLMTVKRIARTERDPDSHIERVVDLGFVGEPETINPHVLEVILKSDIIPVVAPTAADRSGQTYNVNADTAAGAIAAAVRAARLLLLTDVPGVKDAAGRHIPRLKVSEARALIRDGVATGGMIPKIETCIDAVEKGVEGAVILDGRAPHAVLLEIFTDSGIGTLIERDRPSA